MIAKDMKKKKPSQPPRRHRNVRCATSVSVPSPLFIEPNATMPTTPRTTTTVPCQGSERENDRHGGGKLTYKSVLLTGVPTRKRANKKLKTREEEPSGATYSARMYSSASVLPMS
jgi:hypothetical protein